MRRATVDMTAALLLSGHGGDCPARRLGQSRVRLEFRQARLDNGGDRVEGIASCSEQRRRVLHAGDLDEHFTQRRRIVGLLTVVHRPDTVTLPAGP